MPKEENDAALQEPALKKKFQSVEICVFHQFDNSLLLVFFVFFHFVSLVWNTKPLLMPQILRTMKKLNVIPEILILNQ